MRKASQPLASSSVADIGRPGPEGQGLCLKNPAALGPILGQEAEPGACSSLVTHGNPGSDLVRRGSWHLLYQVKVQGGVFSHSAPTVCRDISAFGRPYLGANGNVSY